MTDDGQQALSHVLWIGGATDSGKSTLAEILAERHQLQVYHYDRHDLAHHEQLAKSLPIYRAFLSASLDERWVAPDPESLLQRTLQSFRDRFPLVAEDLGALSNDRCIVAEGFGLLPEFLAPLLSNSAQAVWLVSSESFQLASMSRRGKPSFSAQVSDPERAKTNLYTRDRLLAEYIEAEALKHGFIAHRVNGERSADELADLVEEQFAPFLFN